MILGWHLGAGNIVIPKSTHPQRLREHLAALDMTLSQGELDTMNALDAGGRMGSDPVKAEHTQVAARGSLPRRLLQRSVSGRLSGRRVRRRRRRA
jgi:hypothetical protein